MKNLITLCLLVWFAFGYAQTPIAANNLPAKRPDAASLASAKQQLLQHKHPKPEGERSQNVSFYIDHGVLDQEYAANVTFGDYYEDMIVQINRRPPLDSQNIFKWALTQYPRIIDMVNSQMWWPFNEYPADRVSMVLDTIWLGLGHIRNSSSTDTIQVSVWDYDALTLNASDSAAGGILYGRVNKYIDSSLTGAGTQPGTVSISTFPFVPASPIVIPHGKRFVIQVDFFGPGNDEFYLIVGRRNDCGNATCGASMPYVNAQRPDIGVARGFNSLAGVRYVDGVTDGVYPSTLYYNDCNNNQVQDTSEAMCELLYLQDLAIYPNIQAAVNDTFAFVQTTNTYVCPGATVYLQGVAGVALQPPLTYHWGASNVLLQDTQSQYINFATNVTNTYVYLSVSDAVGLTVYDTLLITVANAACGSYDTLSGFVFFDSNNNGLKDTGEEPYTSFPVTGDGNTTLTDTAGYYKLILRNYSVTHQLRIETNLPGNWFSVPAAGVYFTLPGLNLTDRNFGLKIPADTNNVAVFLMNPGTPPRPGFNFSNQITVSNYLQGTLNGLLKFEYDSLASYISSSPPADNVNLTNYTLTWNIVNMPGASSDVFNVTLNIPPTVPLATVINTAATVLPDTTFGDYDIRDNTDILLQQTVVGSYDPNDKSCSPVGVSAAHSVLPEQELTYTIRFQNTGTFYAENVIVTDTIDADLEMNTFRMLQASHQYVLEKQGRNLAWHFNQIMLPDSNTNEPESHGFIQYKITPKTNVSNLSPIENTAFIYFDFNSAIVTNTTSNLIDFSLGIGNITGSTAKVWVYPNPFSSETNFVLDEKITEPLTLKVFDVTGRLMDEQRNISASPYKYSQSKLTKGIYSFSFEKNGIVKARGKMVVQ